MGTTTKYEHPFPEPTAFVKDGAQAFEDLANSVDAKHPGYSEGPEGSRPTSTPGSPGIVGRIYRATDTGRRFIDHGTGWDPLFSNVMRSGQTFAIAGEVRVPVGEVDVIPLFYVPVAAAQTTKLVAVRHRINAGTSVSFKVQKNGADLTGFTGLVATTAGVHSDPTDQALADGDRLAVVVTAVSGTPRNFTATLILEHTV